MAMITALFLAALIQTQKPEIPLNPGLGHHTRKIATKSSLAQKYFDQGLAYLYGFNHSASRRSFTEATKLDPHCAMAYWGIAMACGPNINDPEVDPERAKAAWDAVQKALARDAELDQRDKPFIDAINARYMQNQPADRAPLDKAYADSMGAAWAAHPEDADLGSLYAEALMDLHPWHQWNADGTPGPDTMTVLDTLHAVLKLDPNHPMANHLLIHATESSPHPEWGLEAADKLRDMEPNMGHMDHMPSHTYVRTGRWKDAILANQKAIAIDNAFLAKNPAPGIYLFYMAHNREMLAYACMMRGESKEALRALDEVNHLFPPDLRNQMASGLDQYLGMQAEGMVRFGKWDDVLKLAPLGPKFPMTDALRLGSRGVAYAAKGDIKDARVEQAAYKAAVKALPPNAGLGQNTASGIFAVEDHLLEGEILYREGKIDDGIAELRKAVDAEDQLSYDEPPDWLIPTRHTLGAALMDAGRYADALPIYQEDLKRLPENGWSLYGISRCLTALGKTEEARPFEAKFKSMWADSDMAISSSCMCLPAKK